MAKAKRVHSTPRRTASPHSRQPNLRALTQFFKLPPGHKTFHVKDDGSDPHLKAREFAVVDVTDRQLQHGELYGIQYSSGNRSRKIVQARTSRCQITASGPEQQVWWVGDLAGWREIGSGRTGDIRTFAGLSDGPYLSHDLQTKLIGRVVGFAATALGDLLPSEFGWDNEQEGNAAFDPSEYIDVMTRSGHQVFIQELNDGHYCLWETMPENAQSQEQQDATMAIRMKYLRASKAPERVHAECMRRGLFT